MEGETESLQDVAALSYLKEWLLEQQREEQEEGCDPVGAHAAGP